MVVIKMKINYEKLNNGLDFIYTVGFAILFMILGIYIRNIVYNLVAYSYGIWIISLWVKSFIAKRSENIKTSKKLEINHSKTPQIIQPIP